jgi:hypothetical protein
MKHTTPWSDQKMNPIDVQERIDGYVDMVQHKMNDYWNSMNFTNDGRDNEVPVIEIEYGNKYARVIHRDYSGFQRSVHSFVNMINGDILKAGGWKAPAPNGVRGNIFTDDFGASVVNNYGASYINGPR